jgi:hypothetical protein
MIASGSGEVKGHWCEVVSPEPTAEIVPCIPYKVRKRKLPEGWQDLRMGGLHALLPLVCVHRLGAFRK